MEATAAMRLSFWNTKVADQKEAAFAGGRNGTGSRALTTYRLNFWAANMQIMVEASDGEKVLRGTGGWAVGSQRLDLALKAVGAVPKTLFQTPVGDHVVKRHGAAIEVENVLMKYSPAVCPPGQ